MLYHLPDSDIEEIKISPGIMMIMRTKKEGLLPLQVRCIETGNVLSEVMQAIEKGMSSSAFLPPTLPPSLAVPTSLARLVAPSLHASLPTHPLSSCIHPPLET